MDGWIDSEGKMGMERVGEMEGGRSEKPREKKGGKFPPLQQQKTAEPTT
jgi:hypothetical protein